MTDTDPIRTWAERRRQAQRDALTAVPAEQDTTQDTKPVESLTAGAEPQAPPPRTMDDRIRDRDDWGGHAA